MVDEGEIASRNSEFQLINENQKRALHEHHVRKKKCYLSMREVFIDAFWMLFEHCCWQQLTALSSDVSPTVKVTQQFGHNTILSVDKNNIIRPWREKCMMMSPVEEQHHIVPFHERWIQQQFKEEKH